MRFFNVLTVVATGLALAPSADARRRRRSVAPPPPPPEDTYSTDPTSSTTSSSATSTAMCNATVSSETSSEAKAAFTDAYQPLVRNFCTGSPDLTLTHPLEDSVKAIANLVIDSKITCSSSGNYAKACGETWGKATSYAGAQFEAYASSWADVLTEGNCQCSSDLTLKADATVAAFGEIWTQISATLDDKICVDSYDPATASAGTRDELVNCTASLIFSYWATATAGLWVDNDCYSNKPTVCDKECCHDVYGALILNCDCQGWQDQCKEHFNTNVKIAATATITGYTTLNETVCTTTIADTIANYFHTFPTPTADFVYTPVVDYTGDANAECTAFANATSTASAVAGIAHSVAGMFMTSCSLPYDSGTIEAPMTRLAHAYAGVYTEAWTKCKLSGDGVTVGEDGGCAFASSFTESFAYACGVAIANATAGINFTEACGCTIDAGAAADALAYEVSRIHAYAELNVTAQSCSDSADGVFNMSSISRSCLANSVATLYSKAIFQILLEGECVDLDKDYCDAHCRLVYEDPEDPNWDICLTECTQNSTLTASAIAEGVATITVNNTEVCENDYSPLGVVYVTAQETQAGNVTTSCPSGTLQSTNLVIGITIDESGSVGASNFVAAKDAVAAFIADSTQQYDPLFYVSKFASGTMSVTAGLVDGAAAEAAIRTAPYGGGSTNIKVAVEDLDMQLRLKCSEENTECIGLVLTDGVSSPDPVTAAAAFKNNVGKLVVFGIGNGVSVSQITAIASPSLAFQTADFSQLPALFTDLLQEVCSN